VSQSDDQDGQEGQEGPPVVAPEHRDGAAAAHGQLPADLPPDASHRLAELEAGLFTSDLSVNEFLLIKEVGFHPLGLVMGSSIYHIGVQTRRWGQSQELTKLTEKVAAVEKLMRDVG